MTLSTAYRDGWLAHRHGWEFGENPYDSTMQAYSYIEWERGHRDRAAKLPDEPYLEILDQEMMGS